MSNFFKTRKEVNVYQNHDIHSEVIEVLPPNTVHEYTRLIRRKSSDWLIFKTLNGTKSYVKFETKFLYTSTKEKLHDLEVTVFQYIILDPNQRLFKSYLKPVSKISDLTIPGNNRFEIKRVESHLDGIKIIETYDYDPSLLQINVFRLKEGDEFHLFESEFSPLNGYSEVICPDNKVGFVFNTIQSISLKNIVLKWLLLITMIVTVLSIIGFFLSIGWLVFGKVLVLVGLIFGLFIYTLSNFVIDRLERLVTIIIKRL